MSVWETAVVDNIKADDKIVGGLGVSGGTAEQDTALAAYGREQFEEMTQC